MISIFGLLRSTRAFVLKFVEDIIKTFQAASNVFLLRDCQTFAYSNLSNQDFVTCVRLRTQPKYLRNKNVKNQLCLVYGKMLFRQFPYMINH